MDDGAADDAMDDAMDGSVTDEAVPLAGEAQPPPDSHTPTESDADEAEEDAAEEAVEEAIIEETAPPAVVPLSVVPAGMLPSAADAEWQAARAAAAGPPAPSPPPPPPQPPPPAPPPPAGRPVAPRPTPRASQRAVRQRTRFGDGDESSLDGPARAFQSAPPPRRPSIDPSHEMGVPAYALPGEEVWAMGLHAGMRKRFKAKVLKLRKMFPRIVVKYTEDESGNSHSLALPDPITAYLTMSDVEPGTLILP